MGQLLFDNIMDTFGYESNRVFLNFLYTKLHWYDNNTLLIPLEDHLNELGD